MKQRRLISILLTLALVISILACGTPALSSTIPTSWAVPEMNDANTSGLLTPSAAKDFHRALTRDEFCELVVLMAERMLGRELPVPTLNPFIDSNNVYVQKANLYGVIYGVGDGRFDPDSKVERQQLCAMMVRAIKKLETDTGRSYLKQGVTLPFKDNGKIADYAVDSVKQAYASGIMLGDDTGNFNPTANITAEQCVAVVIRSLNKMQEIYSEGRSETQIVDMAYDRLHIGFAYGDTENGVTRDIVLTSKGAGGAEVTWRSANENVVSSVGTVKPGASPVVVTLTAVITYGAVSRDKVFTLTTSPYSDERLLLENAYNGLEITYLKSGDGPNSVTGRINLPGSVLGLPVIWHTSDSGTITVTGQVYQPTGTLVKTVTLTATIVGTNGTRQKTFELKVNNPSYTSRGVSLYGVELGMTQSQVAQTIGAAKRSFQVSSSEIWNVYHTDYKDFVAVAYWGSFAVAIYSSATDVSDKLRDASNLPLTAAQANGLNGVTAVSYTDAGNSNREYAIMIYDPSSPIGTSRSLYADGQEQLLLELINAFRYRNSRTALEWSSRLGTAARNQTHEMSNYNYLNTTSRSGYSLKDRAEAQGYEPTLVSGGNVLGGAVDTIEFLHNMINITAMRNDILGNNNTSFGAGFTSGGTGQYKTYLTYIIGTLRPIKAVASNPATVSVAAGKTQNVTLTMSPTNANEAIRWTTSNPNVITLTGTEGAKNFTVTGVGAGTANIIVTGVSSGNKYYIPVSVGTTYAKSLTLKYGDFVLVENPNASQRINKLLLGSGDTLQLTPVLDPATGPVVTWTSSNTNIATVNSAGLVTAKSGAVGTVTITARVNTETGIDTKYVTIYVSSLTLDSGSDSNITAITLNKGGSQTVKASVNSAYNTDYEYNYTWMSSNQIIASVRNPKTSSSTTITDSTNTVDAVESGKAEITVTAEKAGMLGSIIKKFTVNVRGAEYAEKLKLWSPKTELTVNESMTIIATTDPVAVEKNTIEWYSFDDKIATVNQNGVVTGKKSGTTTIYAAIDKKVGGKIIEEITIEVKDPEVVPVAMEIYVVGGTTEVFQNDTVTLGVKFTPTNVTNTDVTWSGTNGATVNNSNDVTFLNTGPVMITATSKSNGITAVIFFNVN